MISEPDPATRGPATRSHSATSFGDRNDDDQIERRNGNIRDSLWSVVRFRLFDASEWHLRVARFQSRAGRTTSAEASYRKILARHPKRLAALIGLGRLLLRNRRYGEAVEVWQRAVTVEPEGATPTFQLARALHRNGELERAAAYYLRGVTWRPAQEKAIAALEEIGKRLVRADASAPHMGGTAAAAAIGRELWALRRSVARAGDGAVVVANAIVDSAASVAPRSAEAALARYDAALGVGPDLPEALRGASVCFEQLGRLDDALDALDRLTEIVPEAIEPRLRSDRIRAIVEGSSAPSLRRGAMMDVQERNALLDQARRLLKPEPEESGARSLPRTTTLDAQERNALLDQARRLLQPEPEQPGTRSPPRTTTLDAQERNALLDQARRLLQPEPEEPGARSLPRALTLDAQARNALLDQARRLLQPEQEDSGARSLPRTATLDAQARNALLDQARRLLQPESQDSSTRSIPRATTLNTQARNALLDQARRLLQPEPEDSGARSTLQATTLDAQERSALLDQARRLLQPEDEDSDARAMPRPATALGLQERSALLDQARRLLQPEDEDSDARAMPRPATALGPQERTALLDQARRLLQPEVERAVARSVPRAATALDPEERNALLDQARRLLQPEDENADARSMPQDATALDPEERNALLDQARRLLQPDEEASAARLDPQERVALLSRAQRLLTPVQHAPDSKPDQQESKAMLARAEHLLGREAPSVSLGRRRRPTSPRAETPVNRISPDQLLQQARSAEREGKLEEAEAIFVQLLDADGRNRRALMGLSRLYLRQRRWADAAAVSSRLATEEPTATEPRQILARALLEEGRLDMAQRVYAELAGLEPANPAVWRSLGRVHGRLGNWADAREAWRRVIEIDPALLEARLELAEACRQAGDGDAAQAELQSILALDPDHRGALTQLGRLQRIPDPDASLACWSRLADLDRAAVEPWLQIARIHLRHQRLEEAEAGFRAVLDRNATNSEASSSLGRILEQRDPEAALAWFARWAEAEPASVGPWLGMGRLHASLKQPALAETAFRRALELAPSTLETLTAVGRFYAANGMSDAAIELWSKVQEGAPDLLEPKLQIARILYARRDPGAVEALLAVLKVDLQNQEVLGRLTQLLGRRDVTAASATAVWEQLAGLQSDSVPSILLRARLLEAVGRAAEAEAEYRHALALEERHPVALDNYATLLREQQRWEEAIEIYRARLQLEPDRAETLRRIGQCFNRLDRLQDAREYYDRALALEPDNITALGYRGRLLRALAQVDASIADFRRICELDPGNAQAWRELIFWLAGAEREAEALAALENAEAALGKTPQTWMALGAAAASALFEEQAVAYYRRAIAAEPENPACHAQLGLHYLRQGVPDGAFHHLLDSRELDPRNVEVARGLFDTTRLLRELGFDPLTMRRGVRTAGEILVPEQLFAHVRRVAETRVEPYEPVPRRVIAISATLAPGGAERQLVNMLRGLSDPAFGLELALFCISLTSSLRRDFFLPLLDGTGVEVVVPESRVAEDYLWEPEVAPFADVIRHFPADMTTTIAFWLREFRRRRPEVVHAWQDSTNLTAVVAALLAGVPRIILCCRSVRPDNPRRRLRRFMREAYRAVLDHPAVVLSNNSRAGANDYAEWLELEPARVEVVYNGIDFDRLDSAVDPEETARARQALGIPPGALVLGGVYRMSEEKRPLLWLDVAAEVARQNDTVHFVVCGDGPMRDEMRSYAATLGIADRVHLPGAQSNIGAWYRMMDVVMLTSRHEGLPNVLLEAQSLGVPVVAPDVGGMSEVVDQGVTGWTIRNADAASLAERVLHCLTDLDWRREAVERAPRFVRDRFGVATMLRRNLEVYGIEYDPHGS